MKIITFAKSWNLPVFSKKTPVKLAPPSFWLPRVQVPFVLYKLFFPREKELKIKQKRRCWQGILHPCKPHTESSHKLELQAYPVIHIYTTPPTFSSSILPLFPCPIRGPSRRGSEHQQAPRSCPVSYICFCPAQRPSLSLLFPKAEGRATKEIWRPCIITSFSLPKECHSQNSKQKLGSGGQEMRARNQSKWPAESETFRNKESLERCTHSNPLHSSYNQVKYHLDFWLAGLLIEKAPPCFFTCVSFSLSVKNLFFFAKAPKITVRQWLI